MKSNVVTVLVIVSILMIAGYFTWQSITSPENDHSSEAAKTLLNDTDGKRVSYTDLDGNPVDLAEFSGKIRVVNSWATWCPFCKDELKDFEKLAVELGEEGVVIAINRGEPSAKIKAYLSQAGTFEHIIFIKDESDHFYKTIGGFSMPETIFYNNEGSVTFHKRGSMKLEEMRTYLEEAKIERE